MLTQSEGSFHRIYEELLDELLRAHVETNVRTGQRVKVLEGGVSFRIDLSSLVLPTCGLRRTYPSTAAAELVFFLKGERDLTWLRRYAKIWDKFTEDDGLTVSAAYGYRWRQHFRRDQVALALESLEADPSDRRVYIAAWDPATDGLGARGQKNVPCPVGFTLSLTAGVLHSTMMLRSSDVFVGLPYDVMGHAMLMSAMAASLGTTPGVMQIAVAHAHMYEPHWKMAEACLQQEPVTPSLDMPGRAVDDIVRDPDGFVEHYREASARAEWPSFAPRPELVA